MAATSEPVKLGNVRWADFEVGSFVEPRMHTDSGNPATMIPPPPPLLRISGLPPLPASNPRCSRPQRAISPYKASQKSAWWCKFTSRVQAEAYLSKLDPIVAALKVSHPTANYDRRSLGQLFGQLEQLMEDALGIKVRPQYSLCMHWRPNRIGCI